MAEPETARAGAIRPDDLLYSRLARLVLLLAEAPSQPYRKPADIERLGTYDFFADNPHLLFDEDSEERRALLIAGFDPRTLSYHSSSQRFTNRRARMQHDLAQLLSRGVITARPDANRVVYSLTDTGEHLAAQFESGYADAYRTSARLVANALNRLSDSRLRTRVAAVLEARPFVIDLYAEPESANLASGSAQELR
jgi:DNA-binding transcriptional ArsR family regulator